MNNESETNEIRDLRRQYGITIGVLVIFITIISTLYFTERKKSRRLEVAFNDLQTRVDAFQNIKSLNGIYSNTGVKNDDNDDKLELFQLVALENFKSYPNFEISMTDKDDDGRSEIDTVYGEYEEDMRIAFKAEVLDSSRLIFVFYDLNKEQVFHIEDKNMDGYFDIFAQGDRAFIQMDDQFYEIVDLENIYQESFKIDTPDGEIELIFGEHGWEEK